MSKWKDLSIRELQERNYLCCKAMHKILDAMLKGTIQLKKEETDELILLLMERSAYTSRRIKREKYKRKNNDKD